MNRTLLTSLGCSGLLLLAVMVSSSARAMLPPVDGVSAPKTVNQTNLAPADESTPQMPLVSQENRIKQLAQATFGCTCANCVSAVRQMVQQGRLSL